VRSRQEQAERQEAEWRQQRLERDVRNLQADRDRAAGSGSLLSKFFRDP
jgi:hypothetical protein